MAGDSAFKKSDFHLMNDISRMNEALIFLILKLIFLRSRSKKNERKVKALNPAVDYAFGFEY